jgi:bifunctional N-acetylglucosamine-1-phosphate-uridyltransferase/glucosamine-1-phosphate-acetyltransferase GlmU-like protein
MIKDIYFSNGRIVVTLVDWYGYYTGLGIDYVLFFCTKTGSLRDICEVNSGFYIFKTAYLISVLKEIGNSNNSNEFYLTDIIELIKNGEQIKIDLYDMPEDKQIEIMGVNTIEQLTALEEQLRETMTA